MQQIIEKNCNCDLAEYMVSINKADFEFFQGLWM